MQVTPNPLSLTLSTLTLTLTHILTPFHPHPLHPHPHHPLTHHPPPLDRHTASPHLSPSALTLHPHPHPASPSTLTNTHTLALTDTLALTHTHTLHPHPRSLALALTLSSSPLPSPSPSPSPSPFTPHILPSSSARTLHPRPHPRPLHPLMSVGFRGALPCRGVVLCTHDSAGNRCVLGGAPLHVACDDPNVACTWIDHEDGTYAIRATWEV